MENNRIVFNSELLRGLNLVTGISQMTELARPLSFKKDTVTRAVKSGDIKLNRLIEICNVYHLDIMCFFCVDGEQSLAMDKVRVQDDDWIPIVFCPDALAGIRPNPSLLWCSEFAGLCAGDSGILQQTLSRTVRRFEKGRAGHRWVYNVKQMQFLPRLLGKSGSSIFRESGESRAKYCRNAGRSDIKVPILVNICNTYRIPVSCFFCREGEHSLHGFQVSQEEWQPVAFHPERIGSICRPQSGSVYTIAHIARTLGVDPRPLVSAAKTGSALGVDTLLDICNAFSLSPSHFFDDDNSVQYNRVVEDQGEEIIRLTSMLEKERQRNHQLLSRIRHLESLLDISGTAAV